MVQAFIVLFHLLPPLFTYPRLITRRYNDFETDTILLIEESREDVFS